MRRVWRWLTEPVARVTTRGYMIMGLINSVGLGVLIVLRFW